MGDAPFDLAAVEVQPVPRLRVAPFYPFDLRQAGITGDALVDFIVTADGKVVHVFAVRSTNPLFAKAAVHAVEQWRFHPGMVHGRPVNTHMQVPIVFNLNAEQEMPPIARHTVPAGEPIYNLADLGATPVPQVRVAPVYPRDLRLHGTTGSAQIDFVVGRDGLVANAQVEKATNAEFGNAALVAVEQWRFKPGQRDGVPVNCHMEVPIVFNLNP